MTDYPPFCQPCKTDRSPTKRKTGVAASIANGNNCHPPLLAGFPWIRVQKLFNFVDFSTLSRTRKVQSWGFAFEKINRHQNLELAVLALARIMCANIHSQNGTAILAQDCLFTTVKLLKDFLSPIPVVMTINGLMN